jgi:para-aminobenzoate synthetase component I
MLHKKLKIKTSLTNIYNTWKSDNSIFLDSCGKGRYSYIALYPYCIFKSKNDRIQIDNKIITGNPWLELKKLIQKYKKQYKIKYNSSFPLLNSGCVGYLGYDLVRFLEKIPNTPKDDLNLPDSYFIFPKIILAQDHKTNTTHLFAVTKDKTLFNNTLDKIKQTKEDKETKHSFTSKTNYNIINKISSTLTYPRYESMVKKAINYVYAGDSFQIKLSQRLHFKTDNDSWQIYKKLKQINPSPYSAFLNFEGLHLISCSPESLLKVQKQANSYKAQTRPIGGTYPRGHNSEEDQKIASQFFLDKKELAEHTMLIDLERNDLGRFCKYGTVKVNEMMTLEKYSHLMHIVTNIEGTLQNDKDCFDAIMAMFPGGTITGCPKVRTMEIIDELEPVARGPYTGCIGFFNFHNECQFNLIIRTLIKKQNNAYLHVGGGIVADSKPKREYEETIEKGIALIEAIQ